jgi:hypothetical protein
MGDMEVDVSTIGVRRRRFVSLMISAMTLVALFAWALAAASGAGRETGRTPSRAREAAPSARPVEQSPPTISGTLTPGAQLVASPGTWSPSPTAYAYKWARCNGEGSRCKKVRGASSATYPLRESDAGSRLRVSVVAFAGKRRSRPANSALTEVVAGGSSSRREYVVDDGTVHVYAIDDGFKEVESFSLAALRKGVRGVGVCPATATMFISFGGDGGGNGDGGALAYNLVRKKVVWSKDYSFGIDSFALSLDCSKIYMPVGELSASGEWKIVNSATGTPEGSISTPGSGPHNTVLSHDGKILLLGARNYDHLAVYNTATGKLGLELGPLVGSVRPLTIDGADTLSFTTATGFAGFQVESLAGSGAVLWTENFGGTCSFSTCSHGISITPDSKEVAVIDTAHKAVQFWNVQGAASGKAPTHVATVPVAGLRGEESGCAYDCPRDGWVQHSYDGAYVFVDDSGDVISTATHTVVAHLASLENTRKSIEVDWEGGRPIATSGRTGVGRSG